MGKKIVIVTGSPQKDGNTNTLATSFASGAAAANAQIRVFDAQAAHVGPCHGEGNCRKSGKCGLPDDGQKLDELMCWADALVIASPVYFNGFTAPAKAVIDRLYPYAGEVGRARCTVKEFYLLSACAQESEEMFDGIQKTVDTMCAVLDFDYKGKVLAAGVAESGSIKNREDKIAEAVALGYLAASDL